MLSRVGWNSRHVHRRECSFSTAASTCHTALGSALTSTLPPPLLSTSTASPATALPLITTLNTLTLYTITSSTSTSTQLLLTNTPTSPSSSHPKSPAQHQPQMPDSNCTCPAPPRTCTAPPAHARQHPRMPNTTRTRPAPPKVAHTAPRLSWELTAAFLGATLTGGHVRNWPHRYDQVQPKLEGKEGVWSRGGRTGRRSRGPEDRQPRFSGMEM
jgi:hypothetical protein